MYIKVQRSRGLENVERLENVRMAVSKEPIVKTRKRKHRKPWMGKRERELTKDKHI